MRQLVKKDNEAYAIQRNMRVSPSKANAENNHQLDIDILKVTEAYCGKGMVMKRWRARAKGRPGRINKFLTNVTIKVSEDQVKELKKEKAK